LFTDHVTPARQVSVGLVSIEKGHVLDILVEGCSVGQGFLVLRFDVVVTELNFGFIYYVGTSFHLAFEVSFAVPEIHGRPENQHLLVA